MGKVQLNFDSGLTTVLLQQTIELGRGIRSGLELGLELERRAVGYGKIDPRHATEIFIREGLVNDTITFPLDFLGGGDEPGQGRIGGTRPHMLQRSGGTPGPPVADGRGDGRRAGRGNGARLPLSAPEGAAPPVHRGLLPDGRRRRRRRGVLRGHRRGPCRGGGAQAVGEGPEGYKYISMSGFEALIIESFRELKNEVVKLQEQVSSLEARLKTLESRTKSAKNK